MRLFALLRMDPWIASISIMTVICIPWCTYTGALGCTCVVEPLGRGDCAPSLLLGNKWLSKCLYQFSAALAVCTCSGFSASEPMLLFVKPPNFYQSGRCEKWYLIVGLILLFPHYKWGWAYSHLAVAVYISSVRSKPACIGIYVFCLEVCRNSS